MGDLHRPRPGSQVITLRPANTIPEEDMRFFPVGIDSLDDCVLSMDLYLKLRGQRQPTLYRASGVDFDENDRKRLAEQGIEFLYVSMTQHAEYRKALRSRLDRLFGDSNRGREERARVIRKACAQMIEDVLLFPGRREPLSAIVEISDQFVRWSEADPVQFSYLLDMSAHDFYTATHMVNVGAGCGLLARELYAGDRQMQELIIQGGLLHDVGKRDVPEEILNKEGKLTSSDWDLIRRHPLSGFKILKSNPTVHQIILEMTRDHHENLDGSGYPNGKSGKAIGVAARLCAIVDVYDAITCARPYRGPTPPRTTLQIMDEGANTKFDAKMLQTWGQIVDRLLSDDPDRAVEESADSQIVPLNDFVRTPENWNPNASPGAQRTDSPWASERRTHTRFSCDTATKAIFTHQNKAYPVKAGESFQIRILDVSRGGMQVATPFPLSQGDLLTIILPRADAEPIERHVRVVRSRRNRRNQWVAGLTFVSSVSLRALQSKRSA